MENDMDNRFHEALWIVDEYLYGEEDHGCTNALKYLSEHRDFDKLPKDVKRFAHERYHEGYFEIDFIHGPY
jgi:hypothetical protein